jgi:hypothetical protein
MSALRSILYLLTTTSVLLNLSAPPLRPGLLEGTAAVIAPRACQDQNCNGCGISDNWCGGIACCRMSTNQEKVPGLAKRPNNRAQAVAPATSMEKLAAAEALWPQSDPFADASPSLITLRIRLNV